VGTSAATTSVLQRRTDEAGHWSGVNNGLPAPKDTGEHFGRLSKVVSPAFASKLDAPRATTAPGPFQES
jgi:hypothetical protein